MGSLREEFEYFDFLKKQILTNAVGTYGYAHPHAGNYDILTARGFDHRGPSCWVALIVYLSPASNSAWKLLFKSERHDSMIQAMEQVLHRLQDDANVMLAL